MIFNEYQEKSKKLKEDLIYAVEERYEGELEISDVTSKPYPRMVLNSDKMTLDDSSQVFANSAAQLLEILDDYIKNFANYDGRTLLRNSDVVKRTMDELCRTVSLLTLSIRENNAEWQVRLNDLLEEGKEDE